MGCVLDTFGVVDCEGLAFEFHKNRPPVTLSEGAVALFGSRGASVFSQQQPKS